MRRGVLAGLVFAVVLTARHASSQGGAGDEPTPEQRRLFTLTLKSAIAGMTARVPKGAVGAQIDGITRAPLWAAGLDYLHGTGHGVGTYLAVHEGPQRIAKGTTIDKAYLASVEKYHWFDIRPADEDVASQLESIKNSLEQTRHSFDLAFEEKRKKLTQGDELPAGVLKMVKVYLAVKRRLQPGDKMAGRHGNKGVVSKIVPVEDMPYMADGTPCDIVLNPLGVPSRMNVGQVLEVHLGWAGKGIGQRIGDMLQQQAKVAELRKFLDELYNKSGGKTERLDNLSDADVLEMAGNLAKGVPFATPVFDGAAESEIRAMLKLAYPDEIAKAKGLTDTRTQATLHDGRTGEAFERPTTVGCTGSIRSTTIRMWSLNPSSSVEA